MKKRCPAAGIRACIVVGPHGSGKQALLDAALALRSDMRRAPVVFCHVGQDRPSVIGAVAETDFLEMIRRRSFHVRWDSDGFRYGVPRAALDPAPAGTLMISAAETAVEALRDAFPGAIVIHISARADVLRRRLTASGRFDADEIERHLAEASRFRPSGRDVLAIDTSDSITEAARQMLAALDAIPQDPSQMIA